MTSRLPRWWPALSVVAIALLLVLRAALAVDPMAVLAPVATEPGDPPGTTARAGSLDVSRGGAVVLGFQASGPARLVVTDTALPSGSADGRGRGATVEDTALPSGSADGRGRGATVEDTALPSDSADGRGRGATVEDTALPSGSADGRGRAATVEVHVVQVGGKDCSPIADGVRCRMLLPHGALALRFASPPDGRLVWSPMGRRGDPEYVPASSLSPDPPERAEFGSGAGAARTDGAIALAILAIIVATVLVAMRARLAAVPRDLWLAIAGVFALAVAVRWIDLSGFGQTWDEDVNWASGRNYVTNLLGGDFAWRSWQWNFEHPPVMKYLEGIGALLADGFGPARALSSVWTSIGCALMVPIGARLYRPRVGVLAGVIAALLPPLVAHGQIVGHESVSVMWWSIGILLALGVHDGAPTAATASDRAWRRVLVRRLVGVGAVVGLAVASRFVNGLLGPLCAVIVVVQAPPAWRRATLTIGATAMPLAAVVALWAIWPRLWLHPIAALGESLAKLNVVHSPEPFMGNVSARPPPYYFVPYLFATLPAGALLGAVAWAVRSVRARERAALIVAAWLVVPLVISASPVKQDGVRYVMPCVLALAMMAAAGWDAIARVAAVERRFRHGFASIALAVAAYLAIVDVRVHPFYLDYFGEQVGGAGTVAARNWFETAWWGEGVADAVDYVNAHAAPGAAVDRDCIEPAHLAWFREDLWPAMTHSAKSAAWIVSYAPASHPCPVPPDAKLAYRVTSGDLVLANVWQR